MANIQKFEDIEAWQRGRELTRLVYQLSSTGQFARNFALKDQIRRAAISITSNIAEGFGRGGNREFIQFLATAKGSTSELQSQLYAALDAGYLKQNEFDELYKLAHNVILLLGGFLRYLQQSELRGRKFKTSSNQNNPKL
jgi:four helix bundle protein